MICLREGERERERSNRVKPDSSKPVTSSLSSFVVLESESESES